MLSNDINNLASALRKQASRSLGFDIAEAYSKPYQISKMVLFAEIVSRIWNTLLNSVTAS